MKIIYNKSVIIAEMDQAIDSSKAGSILRFELTFEEWLDFLEAYHQKTPGIVSFQPESYTQSNPNPKFSYRGIGVVQEKSV